MISMRWAAACAVGFVTMVGCQKTAQVEPSSAPPMTTDDQIAAAKAKYAGQPGVMVGEVEAANGSYAAVSGLDPKAVTKNDVLTFIDVPSNTVVSHGSFREVSPNGRLIVDDFDPNGQRAPQKGDLCVKLK